MTLKDLESYIPEYVADLKEQEKTPETIRSYQNDLKSFFNFIRSEVGEDTELTKMHVIDYKDSMKESRSTATINRRVISLNKFFKHIGAEELTGTKPIKQQQKSSLENVITQADYERLLRCALEPPPQAKAKGIKPDLQSWAIMQTLANTGIRFGELQYFTVEALSKAGKNGDCITVLNKGKERNIPVSKDLQKLLKNYCEEKNIKNGYIFGTRNGKPLENTYVTMKLKRIAGYARVSKDRVHCHNFRHLFGKTYMQEIGRIDELADILGHSDIATTRIYSRTSNKEKAGNISKLNLIRSKPVKKESD